MSRFALSGLLVVVLVAATAGPAIASEKIKIEKADDLPRHTYTIDTTAVELLKDETAARALAAEVKIDLESDLTTYEIPDKTTLQGFYDKIRPFGRGWKKVVNTDVGEGQTGIGAGILCWFLGVGAVYGTIFSSGYFIYGRMLPGLLLAVVAVACTGGIVRVFVCKCR